MTKLAGDRYVVVSADGHAGAQMHEYRDYLEQKYLPQLGFRSPAPRAGG
jgi:hypothetical protein